METLFLPMLRGYGTVADLSIAMALDADLKEYVKTMPQTQDAKSLYFAMDDLLARWTGTTSAAQRQECS